MIKIRYLIIIFLLTFSLLGCSGSKNAVLDTNKITTDRAGESNLSSNLKYYKYSLYGYEIAYPQSYEVSLSGGHSPIANPEFGMRLSLYSNSNQPGLDIDSIDKANFEDSYRNVEDYIKYKHLTIKYDEAFMMDDKPYTIYKLESDNYYVSFFENKLYIFELSSSSKDILKEIMATFKFT